MNIVNEITPLLMVAALAFLGWGLRRAWKRGRVALLAWLQSLLLILPWVLSLGLPALGISWNVAGFIFSLLLFTGLYILLGGWVRRLAKEELANQGHSGESLSLDLELAREEGDSGQSQTKTSLTAQDREAIEAIFGVDSFFVTERIPYGQGAIFKGNLRLDPQVALERLTERLRQVIGEGFCLFLVEDTQEKPAVVVLPASVVNQPTSYGIWALATGLGLASCLTTLEVGANLLGFRLMEAAGRWWEALPIAIGILATLLGHELGHHLMAKRYGVRLSPLFLIPTTGIGTLGSLNRIESPLPDRRALFDIALAGPAVGGLLSLGLLLVGLLWSGQMGEIYLPTVLFRSSILVGTLAQMVMGSALQSDVIGIHPLVAVGWIGLGITALSLLPAGQLDGGRLVQAVYGRKTAGRTTVVSLIFLAIASLSNIVALYWALLILFLVREPERPPLNEITEIDDSREIWVLVALFLMIMILLPMPPFLAEWLHWPS
ncbi:MAG: site-2 protease family protein [Cyanobacteriota bacterium]|nr:site-2 protease family protein [Cyanobacteriota bacterium]